MLLTTLLQVDDQAVLWTCDANALLHQLDQQLHNVGDQSSVFKANERANQEIDNLGTEESASHQPPINHQSATNQPPINPQSIPNQSPINHQSATNQPPINHSTTKSITVRAVTEELQVWRHDILLVLLCESDLLWLSNTKKINKNTAQDSNVIDALHKSWSAHFGRVLQHLPHVDLIAHKNWI
jgi:hypothetical protein